MFVSVAILNRNNEPVYHGRRLSEWLSVVSSHAYDEELSPEMAEAESAVRNIGTNALPYLLAWIKYEPPVWRVKLGRSLPDRFADSPTISRLVEGAAQERASVSIFGFRILGTNALSAISELTVLMSDTNSPGASKRAVLALSGLGVEGFEALVSTFSDPHKPNRFRIIFSLRTSAFQVGTNRCLPALIKALSDQDQFVRTSATNVLLSIAPEALTNAPSLQKD